MNTLHIFKHPRSLALPADAITQTFGIVAVRGAGKSNTAVVMAEEMFKAKLPFVVIDPVGNWWGLRAAADGKSSGMSIPIFGGSHGDVPLERTGGVLVADLIVDERLSAVLDVSEFSESDKIRFLIDFAERLYRRNTEPLHLFLEEADDYCPQRPFRDQARLVGAWERVVRRGRARGLGITMITQRTAVLNKNVLNMIDTLIALRTLAPQDLKAIEGWVQHHGQSKEILASLPTLKKGEAWIWSPSYLELCERVQIRARKTFDSSATPTMTKRVSATLADIDLPSIRQRMASTIEKVKQDDPRELRRRIIELQRQIKQPIPAPVKERPSGPVKIVTIKEPVIGKRQATRFQKISSTLFKHATVLTDQCKALSEVAMLFKTESDRIHEAVRAKPTPPVVPAPAPRSHVWNPLPQVGDRPNHLPKGEKAVLAAIRQCGGCTREQITVLTGYKRSSRDAYVQRLLSKEYVGIDGDTIVATPAGVNAIPGVHPLPVGAALRDHWLHTLPTGERAILAELCAVYPKAISRDELTDKTGYKRSSRDAYIQRLKSRQLVKLERGDVVASSHLYEEI